MIKLGFLKDLHRVLNLLYGMDERTERIELHLKELEREQAVLSGQIQVLIHGDRRSTRNGGLTAISQH